MMQLADWREGMEQKLDLVREGQLLDKDGAAGWVHQVTVKLTCPFIRIQMPSLSVSSLWCWTRLLLVSMWCRFVKQVWTLVESRRVKESQDGASSCCSSMVLSSSQMLEVWLLRDLVFLACIFYYSMSHNMQKRPDHIILHYTVYYFGSIMSKQGTDDK